MTLRMPSELHNRVREQAGRNRRSVHAEIIALIESGLAVEQMGGDTLGAILNPGAGNAHDRSGDCKHPRARVHKGLCGACGTNVSGLGKR